jgi:hypothetical protein
MLYRDIIAVFSEIHTKLINACVEFLNVKMVLDKGSCLKSDKEGR